MTDKVGFRVRSGEFPCAFGRKCRWQAPFTAKALKSDHDSYAKVDDLLLASPNLTGVIVCHLIQFFM